MAENTSPSITRIDPTQIKSPSNIKDRSWQRYISLGQYTLKISHIASFKEKIWVHLFWKSTLGKGDRYRLIELEPRTVKLLQIYIAKYRVTPRPPYQHRLFVNQRGEQLTRHGIYRICRKYLSKTLEEKRLKYINPVHSFRHSRAVDLLYQGKPITDIKNRLGHDNIQSTTIYLHLDMNRRRQIQKRFIKYMKSVLTADPKIEELLQWENKEDIMAYLDSL